MIMDRIRTHNNDYLTEAMSLIQAETARNPVLKYPFEWESFLEPVLPKGTCVNVWHVNVNKNGVNSVADNGTIRAVVLAWGEGGK